MAKDTRLWMRFPIDFDEDPTIEGLSDAAFRAFVEMIGYSRRQDLDGRIPARVAVKRWGKRVLDEIVGARRESPILAVEGAEYVLTKYARHQQTKAEREALLERNRANGKRGGRPPKGKREVTEAGTESVTDSDTQSVAWWATETKAEIRDQRSETDKPKTSPESLVPNARDFDEKEIEGIRLLLAPSMGRDIDELEALTATTLLIEAATDPVGNVGGYVRRCIQRTPDKVIAVCAEAARQAALVRAQIVGAA